jgi:2'-5' RNA ligase
MAAGNGRMMARTRKEIFSLWLMPEERIAHDLSTLIARLSGKHSTPSFEPHVTLIGDINLPTAAAIAKADELAARIEPFEVALNRVEQHDRYFRCIFIKADKTEPLMKAYSMARAVFGHEENEKYMPHLSLVYGNLDAQTRQRVIHSIGNVMNITFHVSEIFLYFTAGDPAGWHCLSRCQCGRSTN